MTNGTASAVSIAALTLRVSAPANHIMNFEVQTSVAGFSAAGTGPTWNFNVANGSLQAHTFDLGTQVVASGATIDFRVIGYNSSGQADEFWLDSSGGISGTTALFVTPVPEPTAIIGVAALGMLAFRKVRRWKSK